MPTTSFDKESIMASIIGKLQRYNGRTKNLRDGRTYRAAYAERILRRAADPERFVPIARERAHP